MNPDSFDRNGIQNEEQFRNRTILRRPGSIDSNDDESCTIPGVYSSYPNTNTVTSAGSVSIPLQERRHCSASDTCKEISQYKWAVTGWSSCLPKNLNADSTCGEGVRR